MIEKVFAATVDPVTLPSNIPSTNIDTLAGRVLDYAIAIFFFAAFLGVVYSGYMMITAGGDAAKFSAAKKNLIWAIVGVIVVTMMYVIVGFVNNLAKSAL